MALNEGPRLPFGEFVRPPGGLQTQPPITPAEVEPEPVPSVYAAVHTARMDIETLPPFDRQFVRYVWIPPWGDLTWARAISYMLNASVSQAPIIIHPTMRGNGWLVRYDLRLLCAGDPKSARDKLGFWRQAVILNDLAAIDPYFHVARQVPIEKGKDKTQTVVQFSSVPNPQDTLALSAAAVSGAPIYRADWLLEKALTTTDGGKYYDFLGIEKSDKDKTAWQKFLDSLGVKINDFEVISRIVVKKSEVTGKPRLIELDNQPKVRITTASGLFTFTMDASDEEIPNADSDPVENPIQFKATAIEAIGMRRNGMQVYALFSAKNGERQESAPDNVVKDHEVPPPFTARLQPGLSCIRCHGKHDGYQPAVNDLKLAFQRSRLDAFGDLKLIPRSNAEQVQILAGLFAGNPDKPLSRARDDYTEAVWHATGGFEVPKISATISAIQSSYRYASVTPQQACLELGWRVTNKDAAVKLLNRLLPPLPTNDPTSPENIIIALLKGGDTVIRAEFERVFQDLAFRSAEQAPKINLQYRKSL